MPHRSSYIRGMEHEWGKASKGFAAYLNLAGQTIGKKAAKGLADAGAEFMANEDWDWPRGARYDAIHNGRNVRGSKTYGSGYRGGDEMHPWFTGNLHDSIAVGVMQGSRIMAMSFMSPGATEEQEYKGQTIDGVTAGQDALQRASRTFLPGSSGNTLRAVMVIGVPYAEYINSSATIGYPGREKSNPHIGYADYLQKEFYSTILPVIQRLSQIKLRLK